MKKSKYIAGLLAGVLLAGSLSGCAPGSGDLNSTLDEGASEFAFGKTDENVIPKSSDEILDEMIADFSGSMKQPDVTPIPDDQIQQIKDDTDDDQVTDSSITVVASDDDLKQLLHDMLDDTKEVAYFSLDSGYTIDGDVISDLYDQLYFDDAYDVMLVDSFSWGGSDDDMMLELDYTYDVSTILTMKAEQKNLGKQAASEIDTNGLSEAEIVSAVNEYLCDKITYPDQDSSLGTSDGYKPEDHTAYGAFKDGRAVCDGYSKAAKIILNELGIECGVEVGQTSGGGHAWNLVKVEGDWYQMDITWNDGSGVHDEYFLVTDSFMQQSRTWETSWYPTTPTKAYADR